MRRFFSQGPTGLNVSKGGSRADEHSLQTFYAILFGCHSMGSCHGCQASRRALTLTGSRLQRPESMPESFSLACDGGLSLRLRFPR